MTFHGKPWTSANLYTSTDVGLYTYTCTHTHTLTHFKCVHCKCYTHPHHKCYLLPVAVSEPTVGPYLTWLICHLSSAQGQCVLQTADSTEMATLLPIVFFLFFIVSFAHICFFYRVTRTYFVTRTFCI